MKWKVIIAGSRMITNYILVSRLIQQTRWVDPETEIVSGMAPGVDLLAVRFAKERGLTLHEFPADWNKYGNAAGPIRNHEMAKFSDALIAIWDGESHGTANMIKQARTYGLKVKVYLVDPS